jgi:hypothetical protein
MCIKCVVEVRPDRGRTCADHGAYLVNFSKCAACGVRGKLVEVDRKVDNVEEDEEEMLFIDETTFNRTSMSWLSTVMLPRNISCAGSSSALSV